MSMAQFSFSPGTDQLLYTLKRGHPRGEATFPANSNPSAVRTATTETVHDWFRRCVDQVLGGRIESCQIEENCAAFFTIQWVPGNRGRVLSYANLQVLVAEAVLDEYYCAPCNAYYIRVDLDTSALGKMLTHPQPHVHVEPGTPVRLAMEGADEPNVVMDVLELVYRHFFHTQWLAWARQVWASHFESTRDEGAANPFETIADAFLRNQLPVIEAHSSELAEMKTVWQRKKDELFDIRMGARHRQLFAYPTIPPR